MFSACFCSRIVTIVIIVTIKFNAMENEMNVAYVVLRKYLSAFEPVAHIGESIVERGEFSGRVVVKTSEDIIRELEDIVELETNDVVAVMLADGYDLMRRNEVFGWALRLR